MKRLVQTTLNWSSPTKSGASIQSSAAKAGGPSGVLQPKLRRSFSQIWSDSPEEEGLEIDHEILEESLQQGLESKRKWESKATYSRPPGGRRSNARYGLQSRGTAGGWGSNRLYAGMERRRHDCSAAEGVELCKKVLDLQAGGTDAAEVNKYLLKHCGSLGTGGSKAKTLRSLKNVLKKGMKFWKDRLERVQVGKHGKLKKGASLKRVCRTSEARGCRAPGGGRKDRFEGYKAAVKKTFTLELENGQEVAGVSVPDGRHAHKAEI